MVEYLKQYLPHEQLFLHQDRWFHHLCSNVPTGWIVSIQDFSENYTHCCRSEHQGRFFSSISTAVYPVILYTLLKDRVDIDEETRIEIINVYRNKFGTDEDKIILCDWVIFTSADKVHDYHFVIHVNEVLHNEIFPTMLGKNFIGHEGRSDGCPTQYKCASFFSYLATTTQRMRWSFSASCHGKGPSDGAGGTVKSRLRYMELSSEEDNPSELLGSEDCHFALKLNFEKRGNKDESPVLQNENKRSKRSAFSIQCHYIPVCGPKSVSRDEKRWAYQTLPGRKSYTILTTFPRKRMSKAVPCFVGNKVVRAKAASLVNTGMNVKIKHSSSFKYTVTR